MTEEQKHKHVTLFMEFAEKLQEDNFMDHVTTGDETWCYQYDPEAKHQSMEWRSKNSPRPKKARMSKSKIKTMLICFFNIMGIIHFKFVLEGTNVNQTFYVEVLERLIDAMRCKRGELWRDRSLILHITTHQYILHFKYWGVLAGKGISTTDHPPDSPDLAPADFWLFPKL
jgi:histone-lysine N-methyltransferase SETMAR